ncbi:MAG: RsmG family class I SAM-dependent methyltransferase, partial [Alphaproteobacteria bacterium]
HATDSAQLVKCIPSPRSVIFDLGSGAGFPGLILSILTPNLVLLFESNQKKIVFLEHIIHTLGLSAKVIHGRIEDNIKKQTESQNEDIIITSRALGSVAYILSLGPNVSRETQISYLLHKNKNQLDKEIPLALTQWDFDWESTPSITHPDSAILAMSNVKRKT